MVDNSAKILFLDQSGKLGGAELSLLDIVSHYHERCQVGLFQDGPFRDRLESLGVPVQILQDTPLKLTKDSTLYHSLRAIGQVLPLLSRIIRLSRNFDVIYTNTPKAFVLGAIASRFSRRPLVYHLRDILSTDHFSTSNLKVAIALANTCASLVIANSQATRDAFIQAGGNPKNITVVYNGFDPEKYQVEAAIAPQLRPKLNLTPDQFVIGCFSRLSPWKGQHILIEALAQCPEHIVALLVGDALFGEDDYVQQLHQQIQTLGLQNRVQFLGFRQDIPALMHACDLVAHTSTAPEPFGRVIVEAMLCGTPIVATQAGGAVELITPGETGWLTAPSNSNELAQVIQQISQHPAQTQQITQQAEAIARQRFSLTHTNQQIHQLLTTLIPEGH